MIVLFLSFVSLVILVKSESVLINDTQLKDQLQKSLTHVNEMLAEIEGQIEGERKKISQIDYDLNYEDTPPGFLDYEVTDIWWPANNLLQALPNQTAVQSQPPNNNPQGSSNFIQTSSMIPAATTPTIVATTTTIPTINTTEIQTQATFSPGVPQQWPFQNTPHPGTTEFVQELQNTMEKDKFGYFTVGLTKFLELVAIKDPQNITPILDGLEAAIGNVLQDHIKVYYGTTLQLNLGLLFDTMKSLQPTKLQKKAGVGHYILKNKYVLASTDVNACLELYDSIFQPNEGVELFGSLEEFHKYPDGGQKATEVGGDMLNVALMPFKRSNSTEDQITLVSCTNEAIIALNSNLRTEKNESNNYTSSILPNANNMISSVLTNKTSVQSSNVTGVPLSGLPSRRRMGHDSKKLMRHFLTKHRKLFKRLNKHHKYNKPKKHDNLHHKIHRHTYHRKHKKHQNEHHKQRDHDDQHDPHESHDKHDSHDQHNSHNQHDSHDQHEQYVQYEHYEKPYSKMGEQSLVMRAEDKEDTSGSQAYFQASKKKRKSIRKVRNLTQYHIEAPAEPKVLETINKQYLIELAKKFKAKTKNENYRRFIVVSLESNEKSKSSKNNRILHKIREASSYSDEEYYLKTNLYDALRHGNRTFVQFSNDTIPGLSSDEELMIKNNLYKVF